MRNQLVAEYRDLTADYDVRVDDEDVWMGIGEGLLLMMVVDTLATANIPGIMEIDVESDSV